MSDHRRKIPVAAHKGGVGIIVAEHPIVHPAYPYIALVMLPILHFLGSGDHCSQRHLAAIGDSCVRHPCMDRVYILPVDARCHQHLIPRPCCLGGIIDVPKRCFLAAVALFRCIGIDINNH